MADPAPTGVAADRRHVVEDDGGAPIPEASDQRKELKALRGGEKLEDKLRRLQQQHASSGGSSEKPAAVGETLQEKMARLKGEQEQRRVAAAAGGGAVKEGYEAVESLADRMARLKQEQQGSAGGAPGIPVSPRQTKAGYEAVESLADKMARLKREQEASTERSPRSETKAGYEAVESLAEKMARLNQEPGRGGEPAVSPRQTKAGYEAVESLADKMARLKGEQEASTQRSPRGGTKAGYEAMESIADKMRQLKQDATPLPTSSAAKPGYEAGESLEEKTRRLKQQQSLQESGGIPKTAVQTGTTETLQEKLARLKREQAAALAAPEDSENRKDLVAIATPGAVSKLSSSMQQKADEATVAGVSSVKDDLSGAESIADKLKRLKAEQQQQSKAPASDKVEVKETLAEKLARLRSEAAATSNAPAATGSSGSQESMAEKLTRLKREGAAKSSASPSPTSSPSPAPAAATASPGKETLQEKLDRLKREQAESPKTATVAEKLALIRTSGAVVAPAADLAPLPSAPSAPLESPRRKARAAATAEEEYEYEEVSEEGSEEDDDEAAVPAQRKSAAAAVAPAAVVANLDLAREKAVDYKRWVDEVKAAANVEVDFDKVVARSSELCGAVTAMYKDNESVCLNMSDLHASVVELMAAKRAEADERRKKREALIRGMEESKQNAELARNKRALRSALTQKTQLIMQWIVNAGADMKKQRAHWPKAADGSAGFDKARAEVDALLRRLRMGLSEAEEEVNAAREAYDAAPSGDFVGETGLALIDGQVREAAELLVQHERQLEALRVAGLEADYALRVEALSKWCASTYTRDDLFDDKLCAAIHHELEERIAQVEAARQVLGDAATASLALVDFESIRSSMARFLADRLALAEKKMSEEKSEKVMAEALCSSFVSWLASVAATKVEVSSSSSVEEITEALEAHEARMKEVIAESKEKIAACKDALKRARAGGAEKMPFSEEGLDSRFVELTSLFKRRTSSLQRLLDEAVERDREAQKADGERKTAVTAWESGYTELSRWIDSEQPRLLMSHADDEMVNVSKALQERLAKLQSLWEAVERTNAEVTERTLTDAKALGKKLETFLTDREKRMAGLTAARLFADNVRAFCSWCEEQGATVSTASAAAVLAKAGADYESLEGEWKELLAQGLVQGGQLTLVDAEEARSQLVLACSHHEDSTSVSLRSTYERCAKDALDAMRGALADLHERAGAEALKGNGETNGSLEALLATVAEDVDKIVASIAKSEQDALSAWTALEATGAQDAVDPPLRVVQDLAIEVRETGRKCVAAVEGVVQTEERRQISAEFQRRAEGFLGWIAQQIALFEASASKGAFGSTVAEVDVFLKEKLPALDSQVQAECAAKRKEVDAEWERVREAGVLGTNEEPATKLLDCVEAERKFEQAMWNRSMAAKVARSALSDATAAAPAVLATVLLERQLERDEKRSRRNSVRSAPVPEEADVIEEVPEEVVEEVVVEEEEEYPLANFVAGDVQFEDADLLDVFANIELDDLLKSIRHASPVRDYFSLPAVMRKMIAYLLSGGDLSQNMLDDCEAESTDGGVVGDDGEVLPQVPAVVPGLPLPDPDELETIGGAVSDSGEVVVAEASGDLTLHRTKVIVMEILVNPLSAVVTEAMCASEDTLDFLLNHWMKDPLVESMEDKNTLDLVSRLCQHLVSTYPRDFFRKLLNTPLLKTRIMDLFFVKEAADLLRAMLEKEPDMEKQGHPELLWSRQTLVPFVLKKLQKGVEEHVDVMVVESCDYLSQLLLSHYRSRPYFVSEFMEHLSIVTSAMLNCEDAYQPELFSLFFSLVPNTHELSESSFLSESEDSTRQASQESLYPEQLIVYLCSSSLASQLARILSSAPASGGLGMQRWRAAQILCCMVGTLHPAVIDTLISSGNLATVLDLFLSLPSSSMLHCMMLDAIRFIVHHSTRLRHWLLVVYRFVEKCGAKYASFFDQTQLASGFMPHSGVHNLGHLYDALAEIKAVREDLSREELDAAEGWERYADFKSVLVAIELLLEKAGHGDTGEEAAEDEDKLDDDTEQMLAAALLEEMMEQQEVIHKKSPSQSDADAFADAVLAAAMAADSSIDESNSTSSSLIESEAPPEPVVASEPGSRSRSGSQRSWTRKRTGSGLAEPAPATEQTEQQQQDPQQPTPVAVTAESILIAAPSSSRRSWKGKQPGTLRELAARYKGEGVTSDEPAKRLSDSLDLIDHKPKGEPSGGYVNSPMPPTIRTVHQAADAVAGKARRSGSLRRPVEVDENARASPSDFEDDPETVAILAAAAAASADDAAAASESGAAEEEVDEMTKAILEAAAADDHALKAEDPEAASRATQSESGGGVRRSWRDKAAARSSGTLAELGRRYSSDRLASKKAAVVEDDDTDAILAAAAAADGKSDDDDDSEAAAKASDETAKASEEDDMNAFLAAAMADTPVVKKEEGGARRSWRDRSSPSRKSGFQETVQIEEAVVAADDEIAEVTAAVEPEVAPPVAPIPVNRWSNRGSGTLEEVASRYKEMGQSAGAPPQVAAVAAEPGQRRSWKTNARPARKSSGFDASTEDADAILAAAMMEDKALQSLQPVAPEEPAVVLVEKKVVVPPFVVPEVKPAKQGANASTRQRLKSVKADLERDRQRIVELQREAQAHIGEASKLDAQLKAADPLPALHAELAEVNKAKQEQHALLVVAQEELSQVGEAFQQEETLVVARDRLAALLQEERRKNTKLSDEITNLGEKRVMLEREVSTQRAAVESAHLTATAGNNWEEEEREVKRLRGEIRDVRAEIEAVRAKEPKLREVKEQEMATNKKDLDELTADYTTELEKLKERVRVANAMRILQQKRETAAASAAAAASVAPVEEFAGVACPNCHTVVKKKGAKFCSKCRSALPTQSAPSLTVPAAAAEDDGEAKKKVVGRRASMNLSDKAYLEGEQQQAGEGGSGKRNYKTMGAQRKKDPRRAPVTMHSIKGLLAAHDPCMLCQWYNPTDARQCLKCGAKLKE